MHALPRYANKVHGRVVRQAGVNWLQYWFFMYYDDPGFLGVGAHQGDVELIQLRLAASGQPDAVTYAQHRSGVTADWDQVETHTLSPVVYISRGTHASMLRAGDLFSDRSLVPDHNDAHGPRVQLDLIPLSEAETPWAFWPGNWGGTRPASQLLGETGTHASSPAGLPQRAAWTDPAGFHAACEPADPPPIGQRHVTDLPAPPAPLLDAEHDAEEGVVKIRYDIPTGPPDASPSALVIGVDASDGRLPPATNVVKLAGATGELEVPAGFDEQPVRITATVHADNGAIGPTSAAQAR